MLKINLLSMRFDAEREYRKMRAGDVCNYLTMLENRTVRRRVHQNIRNDRKRPTLLVERAVKHERKTEVQWLRRRAKSRVDLLSETRGPERRDGKALKEVEKYVVDRFQRYSRCLHCGTEFVAPSSFAFCGESLLQTGDCKKAWLAARPAQQPIEPKSNADRDILRDLDWAERQKRVGSGKMPRLNTNFCPECNTYVAQNHEHKV